MQTGATALSMIGILVMILLCAGGDFICEGCASEERQEKIELK